MLIADPNVDRGKWHMGTVSEVHPRRDKMVRVVQVKTKDGVYTSPIHRLCLLESVDSERDLSRDQPINGMVGPGGVFRRKQPFKPRNNLWLFNV